MRMQRLAWLGTRTEVAEERVELFGRTLGRIQGFSCERGFSRTLSNRVMPWTSELGS
jgi:hypothetical protein